MVHARASSGFACLVVLLTQGDRAWGGLAREAVASAKTPGLPVLQATPEAGQHRSRALHSADVLAGPMQRQIAGQLKSLPGRMRPAFSSLEPQNQSYSASNDEPRDYYIFHNVMLLNRSLLFFAADDEPLPADLPKTLRLSRSENQLDLPLVVVNSSNRAHHPQKCSRQRFQSKPAILFSGTPWDHNYYEFLANNFMPLFQTAVLSGLLDPDRMEALSAISQWSDRRPELISALFNPKFFSTFALIAGRCTFYGCPWSYAIDSMSRDQTCLEHVSGVCLRTLVVSEDAVLRFLFEKKWEMADMGYREYRALWLRKFQTWLISAEKVRMGVELLPWPETIGDTGAGYDRPRVVIAARPILDRGIMNEPHIIAYLTNNWDVNVTVSWFDAGLADTLSLMQETDVLIGMHGAGLTNALFMKEHGVLIQLLPYGWEIKPGQVIRAAFNQDYAMLKQGHYLQWVNPIRENAFFHKKEFDFAIQHWDQHPEWGTKVTRFLEHPDESLPLPSNFDPPPFWIYQSTHVDMHTFGPMLDKAMEHVKAKRFKATSK